MTVSTWLKQATHKLEQGGVGTARLDALVLLEDIMGVDRAGLLAEPDLEVTKPQQAELAKLLTKRAKHTPLAYVRGKSEFYGRNFVISSAVLEPRPESETMIDLLKQLVKDGKIGTQSHKSIRIGDIGAGSGALGITASQEVLGSKIELLEVDPEALRIAKINVVLHTAEIRVILSDLLSNSSQENDVLLCNLPYVPDDFKINLAASHEPPQALFGGPDGLDIYRTLFNQVKNGQKRPLFILTESLPPQHDNLKQIAAQADYKLVKTDDFIQVFQAL